MFQDIYSILYNRFWSPTQKSSRREYSNGNIAEYWCTISNAGFIFVALLFADIPLFLAGTFSLFSHTIPSQLIHDLDILGVALIGVKVLICLPILILNPLSLVLVLPLGALALSINIIDALFTNRYYNKIGPSIHVLWHLTAAAANFVLNTSVLFGICGLIGLSISANIVIPLLAVALPVAAILTLVITGLMIILAEKIAVNFRNNKPNIEVNEQPNPPSSENTFSCLFYFTKLFQTPKKQQPTSPQPPSHPNKIIR